MTLSAYMKLRSLTDPAMAAIIGGCQESAVRKWRTGVRIPRRAFQRRIMEVTEGAVTPADFVLLARDAA